MNKRALVEYYIDEISEVRKLDNSISNAFQEINPDNYVLSLVPAKIWTVLDTLLREIFTEGEVDWIHWWIYERSAICISVSDNTGCMDLETFDEFYKFAFENKTVSEIQSEKENTV